MRNRRYRAYAMLLAVAAIWGSAGPIIKYTLSAIDPLPFLAYRFLISGIVSVGFFGIKLYKGKKFKRFKANFRLITAYGILAVPIALGSLFIGLDRSSVLDLTIIGLLAPIMVTFGAYFVFKEHITKREKRGIVIILVGVLVSSFLPLFSEGNPLHLTGNIFLFAYLIADTAAILIAKKLVRGKVKSANVTNFAFVLGAITLTPIAILHFGASEFMHTVITLPFQYQLGVWYMAIISGTLAYYLYTRAQKTIEVSEATLFNYLQPIFSVFLAVFWLNETVSLSFIIGAIIVTLGIVMAEYKPKKNQKFS